jgi:hypothetical protein
MGVPTLAPPTLYNYFAYAFWTCKAPLAITKVYANTINYFGTALGSTHEETQKYIRSLYS